MEGFVAWPDDLAAHYRQVGLWEGLTLMQMFERTAQRTPDKLALVWADQRWTYAALQDRSRRLAVGLRRSGIRRGERVLMQLANTPDFVFTYLALNAIGAIPVMALRAHRHAEVRHFLRASAATAYVLPDVLGSFDYRAMAAQMPLRRPPILVRARTSTGSGAKQAAP